MSDDRPAKKGRRLRRSWAPVLALLAVALLAAAGHYFLVRGRLRSHRPSQGLIERPSATMPALPRDPMALTSQPFAGEHMQEVAVSPEWIVLPPDSHLLYGFSQRIGDVENWNLHYVAAQSPLAVESFYRTRMAELGYKLVNHAPGDGSRALTFLHGQRESYWVSIRLADKEDQTALAVVISRPTKR